MATKHHVQGYENFLEYINKFDSKDSVIVYFSGTKLPSGESWCSDCVAAWPVIDGLIPKIDSNAHFVYVEVGDRPTWKNMDCPFRKHPKLRLMQLPTLMKWGTPRRLEGEQCEKPDLVELLFTLEDD